MKINYIPNHRNVLDPADLSLRENVEIEQLIGTTLSMAYIGKNVRKKSKSRKGIEILILSFNYL